MHKSKEDFDKDMKFIHEWLSEIKNPKWYQRFSIEEPILLLLVFYLVVVILLTIN